MLKSELNRLLRQNGKIPQTQGEVVLFQTLRTALHSAGIAFTKEYHGPSGFVAHCMRVSPSHRAVRSEIADVLLLFIDEDGNMRYTFMQNKRDKTACCSLASPLRKIRADLDQWDLLHFGAPCAILSKRNCPKIA